MTTTSNSYQVHFEPTPNPQSMKFVVDKNIVIEPVAFVSSTEAQGHPLPEKLFGFPWVQGVFIGVDFITVTKQDWVEWDVLTAPLNEMIEEHLNEGYGLIREDNPSDESVSLEEDSDPKVKIIKDILENVIRPAVAMDGGDVLFHKYVDQVVYLRMKGSCAGCPSSTYTLKVGIETRLKEALPEIKEVVAV